MLAEKKESKGKTKNKEEMKEVYTFKQEIMLPIQFVLREFTFVKNALKYKIEDYY